MSPLDMALALCRGSYQRSIVLGQAAWSGADLRGKAATWGVGYHRSRLAIYARIRNAGIPARIDVGPHGKLSLVIG